MPKDIHVPARIIGGKIHVKASLGQTVIVTEGPETYTGPVTVTPTESAQTLLTADKMLTDNITVNPIPSEYIIPTGTEVISMTKNGTVTADVTAKASVTVNVNVPAPQIMFKGSFISDGSQDLSLPCPFEADTFLMHNPEKLDGYTPSSGAALWALIITPYIALGGRKSTSGALTSAVAWTRPNDSNRPGLAYSDGIMTVNLARGNSYHMVSGRTYEYIFLKTLSE